MLSFGISLTKKTLWAIMIQGQEKRLGVKIYRRFSMENRIAIIGIIVEKIADNYDSIEKINSILHDNSEYIAGRMGIPYKERKISVISVVVDAPSDIISAMSGKLGSLPGVSTKTLYSKAPTAE